MNSISGLSVLKKPFSWKFTKYHRFQKKIKLQIKQKEDEVSVKDALNMSWEDEPESYTVLEVGTPPDSGIHEPCPQFCWDFDRKRKKQKRPPNAKRADDSEVDSDLGSETEEDGLYSTVAEDARRSSQYWSLPGALGTVPLYENASKKKATKHFYENYRLSSSLSSSDEDETATGSSGENEELEHIYDYVENVHEGGSPLGKSYPVNVFLSLIEGADNTISPDPNIYEVPPGAILNLAGSPPDNHSMHNITPPNGFKDTLTWGRRHELSSLPVDALYSSVVKPKRKKVKKRPGLDVLKNLTAQEDVEAHTAIPTGEEVKDKPGTTNEAQEVEALEVISTKNESLKLDPKNEEDAKVTPEEASEDVPAKSSVTSSNEPVKKEEGTRVVEVRTESEVEKATKELRNAVGKIGRSRRQNDAAESSAEVEKVTAEVTVAENKAAKPGCRDKKTKERPARKPKPAIKPESTDKEAPILPEALDKAEIRKAVDSKQSFKEENAELSSETRGGKNEASVIDESKIKKTEPHKEAVIKSKEITAENHESSEKRSKSPQNKIKSDTNERAKKSDGSQGTLRRKKGKAKHAPNVKSPEETASSPAGDSCPPESNLKPTSVNKKKQNKNSRPDPKEKMKGSKAPAKSDRPKAEDCDAASRPPIIPILKKVVNEKQTQNQERYLKRQISHSPLEAIDQSDEKSKTNKLITPPEVPANKTENNDQVGKTPQNSTCEPKEKFNTEIKFCEKDETSKTSELDDTSRLVSEKETDQTKLTSFSENLQQNTPIAIEISDDGTWGSADPNSTSEKAETESSEKCEELKSSDFLNANLSAEDIKMQHVLSEYGNSYFIQTANKPVEKKSSKPAGANNHVGNKGKVQSSAPAQRCSLRDELKRFVRESEMAAQRALEAEKELPKEQQPERIVESEVTPQEIHKLESGTETEDAEILAKGRKGVLEKTMVRAKKRDSWIKGEDVTLSTDKERRIDDWLSTGAQQLSLPAKLPEEIYDLAMDPNISLLITKEGLHEKKPEITVFLQLLQKSNSFDLANTSGNESLEKYTTKTIAATKVVLQVKKMKRESKYWGKKD